MMMIFAALVYSNVSDDSDEQVKYTHLVWRPKGRKTALRDGEDQEKETKDTCAGGAGGERVAKTTENIRAQTREDGEHGVGARERPEECDGATHSSQPP